MADGAAHDYIGERDAAARNVMRKVLPLLLALLAGCASVPHKHLKYGASSGGSEVGSFPLASQLTGTERMLGDQAGVTVNITPQQIETFIGVPNGLSLPLSVANGGTGANTSGAGLLNLLPSLVSGDCLGNNGSVAQWVTCGSGGGGGFNSLTSGTNTSASMIVGTGASLSTTGSGTISATTASALGATPSQCTGGQYATGVAANGNANCGTPTGSGTVNSGTAGDLAYYATSTTAVSPLVLGGGLAISGTTIAPSNINRTVAGTTDTVSCTTDAFKGITYTSSSSTAVSLPQATGSCGYGFGFFVHNAGTGTVTITPTTSTIGGASSLAVAPGRDCEIDTDSSSGNYDVFACSALISVSGISVGLSMPTGWTVTGSPVTGTGTLTAAFAGPVVGGTKFTYAATGCAPSASSGGATAGTVTLASGPCTQLVITMNGGTGLTAPNGWACNVGDRTAEAAGTFIPAWYESSSTTTTATIPIPPSVGSTDVIRFSCMGY